jgi:DNA-binding CsgD family transcriptional regulator
MSLKRSDRDTGLDADPPTSVGATDEMLWKTAFEKVAIWIGAADSVYLLFDRPEETPRRDAFTALPSDWREPAPESDSASQDSSRDPSLLPDRGHPRFTRDAFLDDIMRPLGVRWAGGTRIWELDGDPANRSPLATNGDAPLSREDRLRFAALTTHASRAVRLHEKLARKARGASLGMEAIESLSVGLAVIDMAGQLLLSNRAAERLLARCAPWSKSAPTATARANILVEHLARALETRQSTSINIRGHDGTSLLHAAVVPMREDALSQTSQRNRLALLIMSDATTRLVPNDVLRDLFHLSSAECRLANSLLSGRTIPQYAKERKVSVETARTQLKAIFAKTGSRSQVQLVAMLSRLPSAWHVMPDEGVRHDRDEIRHPRRCAASSK